MGRGEGPECYCYPNVVIRKVIDDWSKNYNYVVMDNEAGMEHLSRRTTRDNRRIAPRLRPLDKGCACCSAHQGTGRGT